jgi:hypothetical protein
MVVQGDNSSQQLNAAVPMADLGRGCYRRDALAHDVEGICARLATRSDDARVQAVWVLVIVCSSQAHARSAICGQNRDT